MFCNALKTNTNYETGIENNYDNYPYEVPTTSSKSEMLGSCECRIRVSLSLYRVLCPYIYIYAHMHYVYTYMLDVSIELI